MNINNVKNQIRSTYVKKFFRVYDYYNKQDNMVKMEILNQLTPVARDLLLCGVIDNRYINSYNGAQFRYIKDNRSSLELAFGFLVNEIIEVMTKVYFQKDIARLEYYKEATRDNKTKCNSYADFILFYDNKNYYVELENYMQESNEGFIIKETKFKALMEMYRSGMNVLLLNKYILEDKVYYVYYDFTQIIQKDLYKKNYELAGKKAVKIVASGTRLETKNAF